MKSRINCVKAPALPAAGDDPANAAPDDDGPANLEWMPGWCDLPTHRLLADVSLWSADLANLARDIVRVSAFADAFHIDVFDGHFVPGLAFFPDLVAALRQHTSVPFHVHLAVERPTRLIDEFAAAGGDMFTIHAENGEQEARDAIAQIRRLGKAAGIALCLETGLDAVLPFLDLVDSVLLLGTRAGVKGQSLDAEACPRIRKLDEMLCSRQRRGAVRIIADGGIRRHTVPSLRAAGADVIVPGSLVFGDGDVAEVFAWIHSL